MRTNLGSKDRRVRSFLVAPLLVLAVVMWATSAVKTCPLYMPFKFSTAKK